MYISIIILLFPHLDITHPCHKSIFRTVLEGMNNANGFHDQSSCNKILTIKHYFVFLFVQASS